MSERYELKELSNNTGNELDLFQPSSGYAEICDRCQNQNTTNIMQCNLVIQVGRHLSGPDLFRRMNGIEECNYFQDKNNPEINIKIKSPLGFQLPKVN